ncbi:MAG: polymer-forming cytoskeletal protein [Deltaproteobacteria bacterium]|nr:polymer-forming cytoskeletal protein [Deltaproteobacteria bacterium]
MVDSAQSTVVGPSILVNGNLQGDEDLLVLGRVEGSINLTKTINIAESGIVKAEITVRNAVVSGVVVGNITASDSVEITEAGRMVGDIRAPRVIIVDGARFRGAVDMGDMEAPRASAPLPARTTDRPAMAKSVKAAIPASTSKASTPTPPPMAKAVPVAKKPMPPPPPPRKAEPPPRAAEPVAVPVAANKKLKKKVVVKKKPG